jgi:hypothetical protein
MAKYVSVAWPYAESSLGGFEFKEKWTFAYMLSEIKANWEYGRIVSNQKGYNFFQIYIFIIMYVH